MRQAAARGCGQDWRGSQRQSGPIAKWPAHPTNPTGPTSLTGPFPLAGLVCRAIACSGLPAVCRTLVYRALVCPCGTGRWPSGVLLGWLRLSFCLAPSSLAPCGAWVRILQSFPGTRVADGKCSSGASRRMPPVPAVGELAAAPTGETARARQTAGCAAGRRAFFLHGNARCARPRCASRR